MAEPTEEQVPPSRWLAKWVREEKFWQDVTTRTLAALIVIAMSYLYAVLVGYVSQPKPGRAWAAAALIALISVTVVAFVGLCIRLWVHKDMRGQIMPSRLGVILIMPMFLMFIVGFSVLAFWLLNHFWGP